MVKFSFLHERTVLGEELHKKYLQHHAGFLRVSETNVSIVLVQAELCIESCKGGMTKGVKT